MRNALHPPLVSSSRSPLYLYPSNLSTPFLSMPFAARKPIVFFVFPHYHSQNDRKRQTYSLSDGVILGLNCTFIFLKKMVDPSELILRIL